jgi:hypothetical protein
MTDPSVGMAMALDEPAAVSPVAEPFQGVLDQPLLWLPICK